MFILLRHVGITCKMQVNVLYIYSDCPLQNRKGEAARASPWQTAKSLRFGKKTYQVQRVLFVIWEAQGQRPILRLLGSCWVAFHVYHLFCPTVKGMLCFVASFPTIEQ